MSRLLDVCVLAALLGFGAAACKEKPVPGEAGTPAPAATSTAAPSLVASAAAELPPLSPEKPATVLGKVPTPEDLESEAERTVKVDNLESELDRLEAEITAGP